MPLHSFPGAYGHLRVSSARSNTNYFGLGSHTTNATAHTWNSSPTQLVASTAFDSTLIHIRVTSGTSASGVRSDTLLELFVGASGAETSIVGPVSIGHRPGGSNLILPLLVPAGSRLSIKYKSARTSVAINTCIELYGPPNADTSGLPTRWVSYGIVDDASNSRGTLVTAGSSNAWGSWTALTTSTTYAHHLWLPMVDGGTAGTMTAMNYRSQFAIASTTDAATEATNGTAWDGPMWATDTSERVTDNLTGGQWVMGGPGPNGPIYLPRAAGAAVSMRAMCSTTPDSSACGGHILAAVA